MTVITQTRSMPLTEAQRAVLIAAAARPDAALILPARLKGGAAQKLARALIGKALAHEVRARGELPVWRKDTNTGRDFSLVLTKAGRTLAAAPAEAAVLATTTAAAPVAAITAVAADAPAAPGDATPVTAPSPVEPRAGSKLSAVIALLGRQQGSSVAEVMAATGWLPHTTRAALTSLRKRGYRIQAEALGELRPETRRMLTRLAEAGAGDRRAENAGGADNASAGASALRPAAATRSSVPIERPAPQPGTVLVREWQGAMERVSVVGEGYSWRGATYPSLSAVALAITGTKWNGRRFFGLDRPAAKAGARP